MPGNFCVGEWVRNKKPYFGEPAYKIKDDSSHSFVTMFAGNSIHGVSAEFCSHKILNEDLVDYYEHAGLVIRLWLFTLGNIIEMWRDIKTALKNVQ